jgi:hypothetical protein
MHDNPCLHAERRRIEQDGRERERERERERLQNRYFILSHLIFYIGASTRILIKAQKNLPFFDVHSLYTAAEYFAYP